LTDDGKKIGDPDYVENVLGQRGAVEEMFPGVCGNAASVKIENAYNDVVA